MDTSNFQTLNSSELAEVEGGLIAEASLLLGLFMAGYTIGKDIASR